MVAVNRTGVTSCRITLPRTGNRALKWLACGRSHLKGFLYMVFFAATAFCNFVYASSSAAVAANIPATFSGDTTGRVAEDTPTDTTSGVLVVNDPDGDDRVIARTNARGKFGTFSITAAGAWTYTLDNSNKFTDALWDISTGEYFQVKAADDTTQTILIYVRGVNDPPVANAGPDRTVDSGNKVKLNGQGSDPESQKNLRCRYINCSRAEAEPWPISFRWAVVSSLNGGGVSFPALQNANTASPELDSSTMTKSTILTIRLTVTDRQGNKGTDTMKLTVTVPTDRPAVFSGDQTVNVFENAPQDTVRGTLAVNDPDGMNQVVAQTDTPGRFGTFSITTVGAWTYWLDNDDPDTNALTAGTTNTDRFPVVSYDGTRGYVEIKVIGADESATFSGNTWGVVTENFATDTASGVLVVNDPDGDNRVVAQNNAPGKFGTFSITAEGAWTYTLDNSNRYTDALWTVRTWEYFQVRADDGTTQTIIIIVWGKNDPPVANAGPDRTVDSGNKVKLNGQGHDPESQKNLRCRYINCIGTQAEPWPISYRWAVVSSLNGGGVSFPALQNANTASPELDSSTMTKSTILTIRLTVTDRQGNKGTDTMKLTVTVPTDQPAVFSGDQTVNVYENAPQDTVRGTLAVNDPDGMNQVVAQTDTPGRFGTFSITTVGAWTYWLDNDDPDTDRLTAGTTNTDRFPVVSYDGTRGYIEIKVVGANDPATFSGDTTGAVTEDSATDTASGVLAVNDVDGDNRVAAQINVRGKYGTFSITAEGAWIYTLDNSNQSTDMLEVGALATDVFDVNAVDGTTTEVAITISGVNDPPSADAGEDQKVSKGNTAELSGVGSKDPEGGKLVWLWEVISSSNNRKRLPTLKDEDKMNSRLETGTKSNDKILVRSTILSIRLTVTDPAGASSTDTIEMTVVKTDDKIARISGNNAGAVIEDSETDDEASGVLVVNDPDGFDEVRSQVGTIGTYGIFSITEKGVWIYKLDNTDPDTNTLEAGEKVTDVFSVETADGTDSQVTITVTGANDQATFAGNLAGMVRENAMQNEVAGKLVVNDLDGVDQVMPQTDTPGRFGVFSITADGTWIYTLDNRDPDTDALPAGVSDTDIFPLETLDGTNGQVTITVTGTNDRATITVRLPSDVTNEEIENIPCDKIEGSVPVVTEDAAVNTICGIFDVEDPDESEGWFRGQRRTIGTFGTFRITTAGIWTYNLNNAHRSTDSLWGNMRTRDYFNIVTADGTKIILSIDVLGTNDPPIANAGPDRSVILGRSVTLAGRGNDPDTGLLQPPLAFRWEVVSSSNTGNPKLLPRLLNGKTANPIFDSSTKWNLPLLTKSTVLTIRLRVTDFQNMWDEDEMKLKVTVPGDRPATFSGDLAGMVTENAIQNIVAGTLTVADEDGLVGVQEQSNTPGTYGFFSISTRGGWRYTLDNADPDTDALREGERATDVFKVWAADGTEIRVIVTVIGADDRPSADAGPDLVVLTGEIVMLVGKGSDPSQDPLTFLWKQIVNYGDQTVMLTDNTRATATFTAPAVTKATTITFELSVSDNKKNTASDTARVLVLHCAPDPDDTPVSWDRPEDDFLAVPNAGPDQTVGYGDTVTLDGSASCEPGRQTLYFQWRQTGGNRVTLDNPKIPTPSFTAPYRNAELTFKLEVSDRIAFTALPYRQADIVTIMVRNLVAPNLVIEGLPEYISTLAPLAVTFRFSENVQGFRQSDVQVSNARLSAFTGGDEHSVFSALVTPDGSGDVVLTVAAGVAESMQGTPGPPAEVTARAKYIGLSAMTLVKRATLCDDSGGNCRADASLVPPGSILRYKVSFAAPPDVSVTGLEIHDRIPIWTSLHSKVRCPAAPPPGMICQVVSPPDGRNSAGWRGTLHWRFDGSLPPNTIGSVLFKVKIDE